MKMYGRFAAMIATSTLAMFGLMYPNRKLNAAIFVGSAVVFAVALWLVRITTSTRAHISDPRVRKLADGIIESQRREIAEMKLLIRELQGGS